MTLPKIESLALELMTEHCLIQKGWILKFNRAKRIAGICDESKKQIILSRVLLPLHTDESVKDTILHEIAHALVGCKHGHNRVWQRKAKEIGCDGKRCYDPNSAFVEGGKEAIIAQSKYTMTCPECGHVIPAHRKPKINKACGKCCIAYNNGKYCEKYKLILNQNY